MNYVPKLTAYSFNLGHAFVITQAHLFWVFLVMFGIVILASVIFLYHWHAYVRRRPFLFLMEIVYFCGVGILLATMAVTLELF